MSYMKIGFECEGRAWKPWAWRDDFERIADGYRVRLFYRGGKMSFDFWMNRRPPTLATVLICVFQDGDKSALDFGEFCADLGYSAEFPDEIRRARNIYRAIRRQAGRFRELLGEDYEEIRASLFGDDARPPRDGDPGDKKSPGGL